MVYRMDSDPNELTSASELAPKTSESDAAQLGQLASVVRIRSYSSVLMSPRA